MKVILIGSYPSHVPCNLLNRTQTSIAGERTSNGIRTGSNLEPFENIRYHTERSNYNFNEAILADEIIIAD